VTQGAPEEVPYSHGPFAQRRLWLLPVCVVVGFAIGLVGAFVQADRWLWRAPWGVMTIPWGALVVLLVLAVWVRGAGWLVMSRWGSWAALAGWLASTIWLAGQSGSGSMVLSAGGRQMFYLVAGVIVSSAVASVRIPLRPIRVT